MNSKRKEIIYAIYLGSFVFFLFALSNFIFGGAPSRFGWMVHGNPIANGMLDLFVSLIFFLGAFFMGKKQSGTSKPNAPKSKKGHQK